MVRPATTDIKSPPPFIIPETREPPIIEVPETGESPTITQAENLSAIDIPDFSVQGPEIRDRAQIHIVKKKENKRKKPHESRTRDDGHIMTQTEKMVPSKNVLKPRCNGITCAKFNKKCLSFSKENREQILQTFCGMESLQLQREFIARFVKVRDVKQRTVKSDNFRRSLNYYYYLPKGTESIPVCKTMFLSTLNVSERGLGAALKKKDSTALVVEVDPFTVIKNNSCDDSFHAEDASNELKTENLPTFVKSDGNLNRKTKDCVKEEDFPQFDDSVADSNYSETCEVYGCDKNVFSSCHLCMSLLCSVHFSNMGPCENNHKVIKQRKTIYKKMVTSVTTDTKHPPAIIIPETKESPIIEVPETGGPPTVAIPQVENISAIDLTDFSVEGLERKNEAPNHIMKYRENKKKKAHENRARGDAYIMPKTGKMVPSRKILKPRCNGITCAKFNKKCLSFSEENREQILQAYYRTESLQLQREFIARFVKVQKIKQRTVKSDDSRRSLSFYYFLPKDGESISVCKTMFLNTLNISEKGVRTALKKKDSTGAIEKDRRGGRRESLKVLDEQRTSAILEHISKFLQMEFYYYHKEYKDDSLYLHLNKKKMHKMFLDEYKVKGISASYDTYIRILKSQIECKENKAKEDTKENSDHL